MSKVKELKRELSAVSGVDFFSPRYRAIFKKYAGDDEAEVSEAGATDSEETANEVTVPQAADETTVDTAKDNTGESNEDNSHVSDDDHADSGESDESQAEASDKSEEEPDTETESESSDKDETSESDIPTEDEFAAQSAADISTELLNTKLELELVRAGIREDRLETAKRLFMPEFKSSGGNVDEIRELIAQYPEWVGKQGGAQGFGMPIGDKADALTNEEKALKRMGIDPRA